MKKNKKKLILSVAFLIIILILTVVKIVQKPKDTVDTTSNTITEQNVENNELEENIVENNNVVVEEKEIKENENTQNKDTDTEKTQEKKEEQTPKVQENQEVKEEKETLKQNTNVTSAVDEEAFFNVYLKEHPAYGEQYATLIISKIGVNAPIIFGADDETILRGVGHDSGSYFPGEIGSIIICEHNYMNNFARLGELVNGDIIEIKTSYGDFYYRLYDEQIVLETETYKLPIQKNEEKLMIYTCYPSDNTGHTPYRYVVYANKI